MYDESKEISLARLKIALKTYKRSAIMTGLLVMSIVVFGNKFIVPDIYEASALVRVRHTLTEDPRVNQVSVVQEEILGRGVLTKVVADLELDAVENTDPTAIQRFVALFGVNMQPRKPSVDAIARSLAKEVTVRQAQTYGQSDVFVVSLTGENPERVSSVINAIVNTFISNKRTAKAGYNKQTAEFLGQQLEQKGQDLRVVTQKIEAFRQSNPDLVAQAGTLTATLQDTRMRLYTAEARLAEANALVENTQELLQNESPVLLTPATANSSNTNQSPVERLAQLRNQLALYRSKYTAEHPDIVHAEREIAQLENAVRTTDVGEARTNVFGTSPPNPEYQRLRGQLSSAKASRTSAQAEINRYRRELARLEQQVQQMPRVQQVMSTLETRRDEIHREYEQIKSQLETAKMSYNAVDAEIGNNFSIIDAAAPPTTPTVMPRILIHIFGMFLGIGAGIGFAVLREIVHEPTADGEHVVTYSPAANVVFYSFATLVLVANIGYIVFDIIRQSYVIV